MVMKIVEQCKLGCMVDEVDGLGEIDRWILVYPQPMWLEGEEVKLKGLWKVKYTEEGWRWLKEEGEKVRIWDEMMLDELWGDKEYRVVYSFNNYVKSVREEGGKVMESIVVMAVDPCDVMCGMDGVRVVRLMKGDGVIPYGKIVKGCG